MSRRMLLQEFIDKSNIEHKNKFDYSITEQFKNQSDKVFIKCPIHGKIEVNVGNHLNGSDCMDCSGNTKRNTKSFIEELEVKDFYLKI